ncbi:MAG TPA: anthranilate synthase family protein [Polyangiaceae bacterium]|nr:anthranilate synthase family protein [Polyangiaceae bacterium]
MTTVSSSDALTILRQAMAGELEAYALIHRIERAGEPVVEVMTGSEQVLQTLSELDGFHGQKAPGSSRGTLVVAPYRQIRERGFTVNDDEAPLSALRIDEYATLPLDTAIASLPNRSVNLSEARFEPDDASYERIVDQIIKQEIGAGEGCNFVIKRTFAGNIAGYDDQVGLTIFRNLLGQERNAYWTFLIRLRGCTLIGASPELHIKLDEGRVMMTPISGTYRFPPSGPTAEGLLGFLRDAKEEEELSMVVDEELKMMTDICSADVHAEGPYLIQMSQLAHVGYRLEGSTNRSPAEVLRRSMFAPTVVGSPLENATRVIARYETRGRSYYSGFAALIEEGERSPRIDSAILIRTAEIDPKGELRVGVGATLVRDSEPAQETKETTAKASALQKAMGVGRVGNLAASEGVVESLGKRRQRLSGFWLSRSSRSERATPLPTHAPGIVILDNEDSFTAMMAYQLRALGFKVRVESCASIQAVDDSELLIVGPGPGDPCKLTDPRVWTSRRMMTAAISRGQPFVAICLGHQMLCSLLGLPIERLNPPNQGLQKQISIFGRRETVGFYNTFAAFSGSDRIESAAGSVRVYRDQATGQIHGLKGRSFASMQFHPESVLTKGGPRILRAAVLSLTMRAARAA